LAVCSWNINALKPSDLPKKQLAEWLTTLDNPDIIVVGFQEIVDLENASRNASMYIFRLIPFDFLLKIRLLNYLFFRLRIVSEGVSVNRR